MPIVTEYRYLKAALNHVATNDVRFYLCGVCLGDGFIAATNGHHLLMIDDKDIFGMGLIIPSDAIKSLVRKIGKKPRDQELSIEIKDNGFGLMSCSGEYEYFKFIDGKFPDVKRADIPKPSKPIAEWVYLDPRYIMCFQKTMNDLTGGSTLVPLIMPTGKNTAAYIELVDNVHGVLMPRRI